MHLLLTHNETLCGTMARSNALNFSTGFFLVVSLAFDIGIANFAIRPSGRFTAGQPDGEDSILRSQKAGLCSLFFDRCSCVSFGH